MKRLIVLLFCVLISPVFAQNLQPRETALQGAIENSVENTIDERWCRTHLEECRAREENRRSLEFKIEEKEERQAYCDRYPKRCEMQDPKKPGERDRYCESYPWQCSGE